MKEVLKLFGAMLAIIVSVSALHEFQSRSDSAVICIRRLCSFDEECRDCGPCVDGECIATPPPIEAF